MTLTQTLTDDQGRTWTAETARIAHTDLGLEDHNIFALNINFEALDRGWSQGFGHYGIDDGTGDDGRRFTSAVGLYLIEAILTVVGCRRWEDVPNKTVLVLRDAEGRFGKIEGIAALDGSRSLIISDVFGAHQ